MAMLAAGVVGASLAVHAWHAVSTAVYVDFVTGVWLTLANDLVHGVFYRDLVGPDGYGGTRYFPLYFTSIGALMRLGLSPLAAGFLVSGLAAALFVAGIRRVLLRFGLPPAVAAAGAVFVFAPSFAQQGSLAIRSDILAAALTIWGLDSSLTAADQEEPGTRSLAAAAVCFTLAFATKVTSLYAPAAVVLSFVWMARPGAAIRLGGMVAAGVTATVAVVAAASGGRAIESWRAVAFAGAGMAEWLRSVPDTFVTQVLGPSRVFTSVLLAASAGWLIMVRARGPKMLIVLFPITIMATTVVLASPGTSYTNQLFDAFAVSLVVIGWWLAHYPGVRSLAMAVLLILSLLAARQSLRPVMTEELRQRTMEFTGARAALVRDLAAAPGPVLSEAPELLAVTGSRPYLLDPFMLRVLSVHRPELLGQLNRDLETRRFFRVILMFDPDSRRGRGWYTNVDFGPSVMPRILANYELAEVRAGFHVYRPRTREPERPSMVLD
jgi:heme exporter protein D